MTKPLNTVDRRKVVAAGVAGGILGITKLSAQVSNAPRPAASNVKVAVTVDGATYSYPNGPTLQSYYVNFRDDGRIVFHLGALGDIAKAGVSPKPYHLGPHHVRVEEGEKVLLDADIQRHWWNAQWTYRSAPVAVKRTPAQIVAANRIFSYGDTGVRVGQTLDYVFKGPMDSAGITIYMPTTGERPDIGLITDPSAQYMLGGKPGPMLAWAQAAGSCPMHFRDEKTGMPVDLIKSPRANAMDLPGAGSPFLLKGPPSSDPRVSNYSMYGGGWHPQQAHYCEMSYLAHMATLDTGFLEDLQYSANFTVLTDAWISSQRGIATIFGELRGIAWAFRNLFMAHAATRDAETAGTLPATCHPSSYWKALLDNQLAYYKKYMTDPDNQTFRLVSGGDRFGPWQADFTLMALAFGVLTGHSDWAPFYVWALGNAIARTNGTSGYPPGYGTAYYMGRKPWKTDPTGKPIVNEIDTAAAPFDWAQSAQYSMSVDPYGSPLSAGQQATLKSDPLNGGKALNGLNEAMMTTRAVLITAAYLEKKGLASVRATYPELDRCINNADRMVRSYGSMNPRASIVL